MDTEYQAQQAIVRYCLQRYDKSCRWTDWPHDLDSSDFEAGTAARDAVTLELRQWWAAKGNR